MTIYSKISTTFESPKDIEAALHDKFFLVNSQSWKIASMKLSLASSEHGVLCTLGRKNPDQRCTAKARTVRVQCRSH